ncbi:MAG TPA: DUF1543 domain-containing protein [Puia sp.]|jgi:hypothetical protein|nr:DUF1543 domain-containing protein [Puia sp.]
MTDSPKLFMILVGCKPHGRFTEQHDIFFDIATDLRSVVPHIRRYWPEAGEKLHIDAWRPVTQVDSCRVEVIPRSAGEYPSPHRLFFINLGGYKPEEFEEFHYKMLVAASGKGEAIHRAKETAFYRHTGFKGAESHIDDKYGVDVDDIYEIEDILPEATRELYEIRLIHDVSAPPDAVNLGYFQLHKL